MFISKNKTKYAFYFIILILISKVIYLFLESEYNYSVLSIVTDFSIEDEELKNIENKGHVLSSIGLSLLIIPFVYLFFKKVFSKETYVFLTTSLIFIISTSIFYYSLTGIMNKIVEINSDKRYEAYYTGLLKYGILSNKFGYEKFIEKKSDFKDDTTASVLISNMFLLSFVDKAVVDRIKEEGKNTVADLYIEKVIPDNYKKDKENFLLKADQIKEAWNQYKKGLNKIDNEFKSDKLTKKAKIEYSKLMNSVKKKYDRYKETKVDFIKKREKELSKTNKYYTDLRRYFRYKGNSRAERKYRESMQKNFGRYIQPSRWCSSNNCPSRYQIRKVIKQELEKEWKKNVGLPRNIKTSSEFKKHPKVKRKVVSELKRKGLIVSKNFNYSYRQFFNAFNKKVKREQNKAKQRFINEFNQKSGLNNIKVSLTWEQFVHLFEKDFIQRFESKKYGKKAIVLIKNGDLNNFYNKLYRPLYLNKYASNIFYDEEDFITNVKAQEAGDNFIKMLYIPPFALFMSLLAGILNLLSVISIILFLPFDRKNIKFIKIYKFLFKASILIATIYLVYSKAEEKNYIANNIAIEMIDLNENKKIALYLKSLNSIIYLEEINKSFYD